MYDYKDAKKRYLERMGSTIYDLIKKKKKMSSSYTRYNLTRVTLFVNRRFVIDLIVKKVALNSN